MFLETSKLLHTITIFKKKKATITGSIGVIMGTFSVGSMLKKIGITYETIKFAENSDFLHPFEYPTLKAQERTNMMIDKMYDVFLTRVAVGRNMTKEQVRHIAQGRIWTGQQALSNGLVDELGGLHQAKMICAQLANIPPTEHVNIYIYMYILHFVPYLFIKSKHKSLQVKFVKFVGQTEAVTELVYLWKGSSFVNKFVNPILNYLSAIRVLDQSQSQFSYKPLYLWTPNTC
ncbi:signal peptide peptidase A [Reticulomyxa filosa]|uniref:Signal peptide peptidase A n=1 Tax=Reticulomyxa filosa TaxID=46433 RepID=X6NMV3_RETFI|nr:signal peptide peptidase A [Reticulomyxa filosa]|eukprot:ETO27326.1 signal peptide peptidase A [Reticulomyxa filosa]